MNSCPVPRESELPRSRKLGNWGSQSFQILHSPCQVGRGGAGSLENCAEEQPGLQSWQEISQVSKLAWQTETYLSQSWERVTKVSHKTG